VSVKLSWVERSVQFVLLIKVSKEAASVQLNPDSGAEGGGGYIVHPGSSKGGKSQAVQFPHALGHSSVNTSLRAQNCMRPSRSGRNVMISMHREVLELSRE